MTAIPEASWLYTRGLQSVRVVRQESLDGCRLLVDGPGTDVVTHGFAHVAECMKRQAEIEQSLVAAGYQLTQSSPDCWSEREWQASDRRRTAG
jgi:hypothetical protein